MRRTIRRVACLKQEYLSYERFVTSVFVSTVFKFVRLIISTISFLLIYIHIKYNIRKMYSRKNKLLRSLAKKREQNDIYNNEDLTNLIENAFN